MSEIVKYNDEDLKGYGFDVMADRAVCFNKHPDGTYMNTRSTYSINKAQYTHFDLRFRAINQNTAQVAEKINGKRRSYWRMAFYVAIVLLVVSLAECSVAFNVNVETPNKVTENHG